MMKFVPKNPASFRNVLSVIKGIHSEVYVTPKKQSVVIWTIDPPKTMIYSAVLPKASMVLYEVDDDEIGSITTYDIKYIQKALAKVKADTPFTFNQTDKGYTEIIVEKPVKFKAKIPQFTSGIEQIDLPEIPFTVWLDCYGALLNEILGTIKAFAPVVKFEATLEKLIISGDTETTEVIAEITPEHDWVMNYEVDEDAELPIKSHYDLKRLTAIIKGINKSSEVNIAFATEVPLYVHWEDSDGFKHSFLLAPRVEED